MVIRKKQSAASAAAKRSAGGFKSKASGIASLWKKGKEKSKEQAGNFIQDPMSGNFKLVSAKRDVIGDNDWPHIALEFVCVSDDEYRGQTHIHRSGLQDETAVGYTIRDLERLGLDTDDLEINSDDDLDEVLAALVEAAPTVRARLRGNPNNDFLNMRIQKLIDAEEDEADDASDADDLPSKEDAKKSAASSKRNSKPVPEPAEDEDEEDADTDEEAEVSIGSQVGWEYKGKEREGEVVKVLEEGKIRVKDAGDGRVKLLNPDDYWLIEGEESEEAEEAEEVETEDEDEIELAIGMEVSAEVGGKELVGKVIAIDEEAEVAKIKVGKKIVKVPLADVAVLA